MVFAWHFRVSHSSRLKSLARGLRSDMTDIERLLWSRLRGRQITGVQFYRQKPIGKYIVDFYAPKARLVVEIDGSQHLTAENVVRDAERDACLSRLGLKVLRFDNLQVLKETNAVLEIILRTVTERLNAGNYGVPEPTAQNPPCPPFSKGGKEDATLPFEDDANVISSFEGDAEPVPPFEKGGRRGDL
jgi:very-short-patch-repair endonuclease